MKSVLLSKVKVPHLHNHGRGGLYLSKLVDTTLAYYSKQLFFLWGSLIEVLLMMSVTPPTFPHFPPSQLCRVPGILNSTSCHDLIAFSIFTKKKSLYITIVISITSLFVFFSVRLTLLSFRRCLYCGKLCSQSTDATSIQIASEATAESRGKQSLMLSQNACRFKREGTAPGGNCIYISFLHAGLLMDAQDLR